MRKLNKQPKTHRGHDAVILRHLAKAKESGKDSSGYKDMREYEIAVEYATNNKYDKFEIGKDFTDVADVVIKNHLSYIAKSNRVYLSSLGMEHYERVCEFAKKHGRKLGDKAKDVAYNLILRRFESAIECSRYISGTSDIYHLETGLAFAKKHKLEINGEATEALEAVVAHHKEYGEN
tara:strand:+ start:2040 stop:2573 length:534 start_codon:yes stop_codon:yes gene_type:complete